MAIYWVDPYIEAAVGGIHGTTDTVGKAGTYASPWSLSDVLTTSFSTANFPGGLTLTDGDEIRLKGLSRTSYLVDVGSDWYYNNYYRLTSSTTNSVLSNYYTGTTPGWASVNGNNAFVFAFDPVFTDQFSIADSDGDKPLYFFQGQYSGTNLLTMYSGSGITGFLDGPWYDVYPNSGAANGQLYIIDPQYYIDFQSLMTTSTTYYFACQSNVQIKVTDGWTSSTVRNGYTYLPFYSNFGSYNPTIQFNTTGNNTTSDTHYDIPKTYFIAFDNNNSVARFYYYINSAMQNNRGNTITQRFGGFNKTDYGYPTYVFTSNYYNTIDGNTYGPGACNNVEINYSYGYYHISVSGRYGTGTIDRFNNIMGFQPTSFNYYTPGQTSGQTKTTQIGSWWQRNGSSNTLINNYSNPAQTLGITYEFLDGATLWQAINGGGLFRYTHSGTTSIPGDLFNYTTSPYLDNARFNQNPGPAFVSVISDNNYAYIDNVKAISSLWYEASGIFHDGRTSTPHSSFQENMTLGVVDFDGLDYRTLSPNFQVKTDKFLYAWNGAYNADTNIHFSSNDYDGIPIGACLSYSSNNTFHYPVIYYNDSQNSNALCFQSNASGNLNSYYKKNIEVPIPAYTVENLIFKADFETSLDWDKNFRVDLQYTNDTGTTSTLQLVNVSTSVSRVVYETIINNSSLPQNLKPRHMNAIISMQNSDSPSKKVWVHDISITLQA